METYIVTILVCISVVACYLSFSIGIVLIVSSIMWMVFTVSMGILEWFFGDVK